MNRYGQMPAIARGFTPAQYGTDGEGQTMTPTPTPDSGYGPRYGSAAPKGLGFLGPLQRPDGSVMTEYSIGVTLDGKPMEIPSIVPTLTKQELATLLALPDGAPPPKSVIDKAIAYARDRLAGGYDAFAGPGEQQNLYPELKRAPIPTPK
jgi:hypothetical protein